MRHGPWSARVSLRLHAGFRSSNREHRNRYSPYGGGGLTGYRFGLGVLTVLAVLALLSVPGLAAPVPAAAQAADSAAAARSHYRAAVGALRAGDTTAAVASLGRAATAWPAQGFYHAAYARLAAAAGQSDSALAALKRLITLGYGWEKSDPVAEALSRVPAYAGVEAAMRAATAPLRRSAVFLELRDTLLHPEGIAWDGAGKRWLVSSVRQRKVVAIDARGEVKDLVRSGQDGLDAALAIGVDSARGLIWVASAALPQMLGWVEADTGRSHLFAFDLATGLLRRKVRLPVVEGGHSVGDLTVTSHGTVFASDTRAPAIYRVPPGSEDTALTVAAGTPMIRSPQGLVLDGERLLVADYSLGIESVDLATGAVRTIPAPPGATVLGIDGLVRLDRRTLIGVQNGLAPARIVRLTLSPDGLAITQVTPIDRHLPEASEPTQGVIVGGAYVYIANSPWSNYGDDGTPGAEATWPAPLVLRLPLALALGR